MEKVRQSNQACHDGDFHTAIVLYNEALAVDPQNCILYSNRSAAYMKIQQYDNALNDAIKARLLNPKWPKVQIPFSLTGSGVLLFSSNTFYFNSSAVIKYNLNFGNICFLSVLSLSRFLFLYI